MIDGLIGLAKALKDIRDDADYYRERARHATEEEARWWNLKAEICDDNAAMVLRRENEAWQAVASDWSELRRLAGERLNGTQS